MPKQAKPRALGLHEAACPHVARRLRPAVVGGETGYKHSRFHRLLPLESRS
jgi:hypothetical protein